jgi:hypothetical protein
VIPPVPLYLKAGAIGPELLKDGRLAVKATELHLSRAKHLYAVAEVVVPGGAGDKMLHIWGIDGDNINVKVAKVTPIPGQKSVYRVASELSLKELPELMTGDWYVDVKTNAGRLVGRIKFKVVD